MDSLASLLRDMPDTPDAPCTRPGWQGHADTATVRREAAKLCEPCPYVHACLIGALERRERFGVWGAVDLEGAYRARYYPPRTRTRPACGTSPGYAAHIRRREPTCGPCRAAVAAKSAKARADRRCAREAAREAAQTRCDALVSA